jgi:uncharacterized membrane protein YkvI
VARVYEERGKQMPRAMRPALAIVVMLISVYAAAAIGLVGLIEKGYGLLTYAFIVLLIIPVLTIGVWRITRPPGEGRPDDDGRSPQVSSST